MSDSRRGGGYYAASGEGALPARYIGSQYGQNGFGQYTAGLTPGLAWDPQFNGEADRLRKASFSKRMNDLAATLPRDSPYLNYIHQAAGFGYDPSKDNGNFVNDDGQAKDFSSGMGQSYATYAKAAQDAGIDLSPQFAQYLQQRDQNFQPIINSGISYGATAGNGATSFGGGDGGFSGEGAAYAIDGQGGNQTIDPFSKWGIFGEGSNGSAFGDYKGASKDYMQNIQGWKNFGQNYGGPGAWNTQEPGQSLDLSGPVGSGKWIDDSIVDRLNARDNLHSQALKNQSGTSATLSGMPGYTPAFGNQRPGSAYLDGGGNGSPSMASLTAMGAKFGDHGQLVGYGALPSTLAITAPSTNYQFQAAGNGLANFAKQVGDYAGNAFQQPWKMMDSLARGNSPQAAYNNIAGVTPNTKVSPDSSFNFADGFDQGQADVIGGVNVPKGGYPAPYPTPRGGWGIKSSVTSNFKL